MQKQNEGRSTYTNNQLGTREPRQALEQSLHDVFNALPETVAADLADCWRKSFGVDMSLNAPLPVGTHPEYFRSLRAEFGVTIPLLWVDRGLLCDLEFFKTAPSEVADAVVALTFADYYLAVKGLGKETPEEQFLASKEQMGHWGFFPDELEVWHAAVLARRENATVNYYASRFALFGLVPPATADLTAIAALLKEKGYDDHAEVVTAFARLQN